MRRLPAGFLLPCRRCGATTMYGGLILKCYGPHQRNQLHTLPARLLLLYGQRRANRMQSRDGYRIFKLKLMRRV